jgi:hypothetical protein
MQAFYYMGNSYRFPVTVKYRLQVVSMCAIREQRSKSPDNRYLVIGNCSTLPIADSFAEALLPSLKLWQPKSVGELPIAFYVQRSAFGVRQPPNQHCASVFTMNVTMHSRNEGSGMFIKRVTIVIFGFFYNYTTRTWEYLMSIQSPV